MNLELLQEANRRGILPSNKQHLYDEAVKRGLIGDIKKYEVSENTAKNLSEQESQYFEHSKRLQKSSGWTEKELVQRGALAPSSKFKKYKRYAELESQGVITDVDLPAGSLELGFAKDPIQGLEIALSNKFKAPVKVTKDGNDLIYTDPTDNRRKLVNPDWTGNVGTALPISGDVIGTFGGGAIGAATTRHPAGVVAGETIGSGVGTGTGEAIRLAIGNALGVHDMSTGDIAAQSSIEGGKAAAITAATGGILAGMKGIKNYKEGRIFARDEAAKYNLDVKEADDIFAEVNKIAGESGAIKGTLGKKSDDVVAQAGELQVRRNVKHAQDFADRDVADQAGVKRALDVVTEPGEKQGGQAVQDIARMQSEKRLSQGKAIVAQNEKEFASQLDEIGKVGKETVGDPTRFRILQKQQLLKGAENYKWEKAKRIGGYDETKELYNIDIPTGSNTRRTKEILSRKAETSTTSVVRKGTGNIYAKNKKPADLADFNAELSSLRKQARAVEKNKQFGDPDTRNINNVIDSMVKDRRLALIKADKGDLLKAIEGAERKTAKFHEIYDRSVIGDLTAKNKNGVFKIKSKEFTDKMLKADKEEVTQLMNVIGDNPSMVNMWKEGVADAYKRVAYPDGKFSRKMSNQFITTHEQNLLEVGFKKGELKKWKEVGGLAKKVESQSKRLKQLITSANNKWGKGKIKSMDANNLMKFVTNDTGSFVTPSSEGVQAMVKKVAYVKNITKNYPEAWNKFKTEYSTVLRDSVIKKGKVNSVALDKAINEQGNAIKTVMGDKYLADLKSINEVAKILDKKLVTLSGNENTAGVIQLIRSAVAPPLTRRGRAFTAAVIFERKAAHDAMARAFLNPTEMGEIAKLSHHNRITRETAELAASLGFLTDTEE